MNTSELSKNPPRNIDKDHPFFSSNRKLINGCLFGIVAFPAVMVTYHFVYSDGISLTFALWFGTGLSLLCAFMFLGLRYNGKKTLGIFQSGIYTLGTIESLVYPRRRLDRQDSLKYVYVTLNLNYQNNLGQKYHGLIVVQAQHITNKYKQAGDKISVLYMPDKPEVFAVFIEDVGAFASQSKVV